MKNAAAIIIVLTLMATVGCQSVQPDQPGAPAGGGGQGTVTPEDNADKYQGAERLVFTDLYAGRLVVHFNETLGIRLLPETGDFYSTTPAAESKVEAIQGVINDFPGCTIKRSVTTSEAQVDVRRAELEELSGKKLADWNAVYYLEMESPNEAVLLMRALEDLDAVELVYPDQILQLSTFGTTPNLATHQGYLYSSPQGGLGATAAWNQGIYGQGVMLVDVELGWHVDHLDLPTSADPNPELGFGSYCTAAVLPDPACDFPVTHGTGIVGILAALDNGIGTTGIAPQATVKLAGAGSQGLLAVIDALTNGIDADGEVPRGGVIVIPASFAGALAPTNISLDDVTNQYGSLPVDASPAVFGVVEQATIAGVTIVESAANGQVDLDNPDAYYPYQNDLSQRDSGAIIVGGSEGATRHRAYWSNCGSRVNSFAWAQGVATTGYPYNGVYGWFGTTLPLPPNTDDDAFFVDMFDGTSSAAAMVAGAATLVQSYAKQLLGEMRFLRPAKIREILTTTGSAQTGGGCAVGKQPDLASAFAAVSSLISGWHTMYPNLVTNDHITQEALLDLRADGLGMICIADDPANSDPSCPEEMMWIPGSGIAERLDFDADGRADLVSWVRGSFKIDLSSAGPDADGFGAWDTVVAYPNESWEWPYVEDMNSDGREDLVIYDKGNGTWYIAYTTTALLAGGGFSGWDHVVTTPIADYKDMDPTLSMYCRPHPADYNGDGWVDLAVACSDGVWYIQAQEDADPSEGGFQHGWPASISYDWQVTHLTPQQLAEAPGWAYPTYTADYNQDGASDIVVKVPDTIPDEGRLIVLEGPQFDTDAFDTKPHIYGGNDWVLFMGRWAAPEGLMSVGLKAGDGTWRLIDPPAYTAPDDVYPGDIYGSNGCHPIAADFDGDGMDDRAVMCSDEWRLAYSGTEYASLMQNGYRGVDLTYDTSEFTLPGRSYSGNISYEYAQELIVMFQQHFPLDPPSIPVDMVTLSSP